MVIERGKSFTVGERLTVTIEKVAHGGHFIARHQGHVIFVRHAIPGEIVEVEITGTGSRFVSADAVRIISSSRDRVAPPCAFSHPGGCGGCDFQHIAIERQRELKAEVIRDQFRRIAKLEMAVIVEEIGDPLHWRTRVSSATNEVGKIGFYASRTHRVIAVDDCVIATRGIDYPELAKRTWPTHSRIEISASSLGARSIAIADAERGSKARMTEGDAISREQVAGHQLRVSQKSFWQSHENAPEILAKAVCEFVRAGDHVLDLYGGVGLFAAALIDVVGEGGRIDLIESSTSAIGDARSNFADFPNIFIHSGDVSHLIAKIMRADVVVLDPPRVGAGKEVVVKIAALSPRAIVYVACDPAALARDSLYLQENGFDLRQLRAYDLFPMTHHVECIALFTPLQPGENKVS
jgi:tRNA/tmRNA/rRNA uracil-C5-methylase (TrmA/RlmC/RlmD family)